jgi:nucleoside-diphosphate-sugar epimerase
VDTALTERTPLRIFLTGATTPLGQAITVALTAAGHKIIGVTPTADGANLVRKLGGLPVYVDVSRASELESNIRMAKADVVVNAAPQVANQPPVRTVEWNTDKLAANAAALAKAAASAGAKFLVHTSYAFVAGDANGATVDETAKPNTGDNPLLKATRKAEPAALNGGVAACVLRFGFLYGPQSDALTALENTLRLSRPVVTGDGLSNWVQLADAAEAVRRAVEGQPSGEIFNIVDSHPTSAADFVTAFAAALGIEPPGTLPGFARRLLLSPVQSDLMALSTQVSAAKAAEKLGWTPQYTSVRAGLEQTLMMWRAASA